MPNPREPKAVKALIDKHIVAAALRRMRALVTGPVQMKRPDDGGTRKRPR